MSQNLKKKLKKTFVFKLLAEPLGFLGAILVFFIVVVAIFAPFLAPADPDAIDTLNRLSGPTRENLAGTDNLGRDLLSRLIFGSRIALTVSLLSIVFGVFLGLFLGVLAGYAGGYLDGALLILFDVIKAFPALLLAITIIAITGPNFTILVIIIGVTRFPAYARLVRAQTMRVKENEYILAAKGLGGSTLRIMFKHIFPNVLGPVFIQAAMDIPIVITFEAGLSFLGLGVPPPAPSWGAILRTGYTFIRTSPWMVIFGGITLMITTLGFTLFGEALRDVLDPKLRKVV